ncbi:hypothetical protein B0H16DRAFT_1708807 [Mycena metata]|uniref:Uncharacterized protein n=1 Tax=Mycena metata TaxID=1033252 RepID=A0AAD7KK10_9AGAR|nr:hypothetical protein B0H16DRAFT_1708807 [Mycena metata]
METILKTGDPWKDFHRESPLAFDRMRTLWTALDRHGNGQLLQEENFYIYFFVYPTDSAARPIHSFQGLIVQHRIPTKFLAYKLFQPQVDVHRPIEELRLLREMFTPDLERNSFRDEVLGGQSRFQSTSAFHTGVQVLEALCLPELLHHPLPCHMADDSTVILPKDVRILDWRLDGRCPHSQSTALWIIPTWFSDFDANLFAEDQSSTTFLRVALTGGDPLRRLEGIANVWSQRPPGDGLEAGVCRFIFVVSSHEMGRQFVERQDAIRLEAPSAYKRDPKMGVRIEVQFGYAIAPFLSERERSFVSDASQQGQILD